jgi:tRNA(fMet)-specific endonuclease VapC
MTYLLDTGTCIALLRGHAAAVEQASATVPDDLAVSSITRYELGYGVLRCDPRRVKQESAKVDHFIGMLHELPFTASTAALAARIRHDLTSIGKPIGPMDILIAATALEAGLILVTGNLSEFKRVKGLSVRSWMG